LNFGAKVSEKIVRVSDKKFQILGQFLQKVNIFSGTNQKAADKKTDSITPSVGISYSVLIQRQRYILFLFQKNYYLCRHQ
jgi:hypothetical protein